MAGSPVVSFSEPAKRVRRRLYEEYLTAGRCSNVAGLAAGTSLTYDAVLAALAELERGLMVMLHPGVAGLVLKCPPWTNLPTPHTASVAHAAAASTNLGCALEALNAAHCYPDEELFLASMCPHCGERMTMTLRNDDLLETSHPDVVVHLGTSPTTWANDWMLSCANNNFFPSADHVAEWERTHPSLMGAVLTIDQVQAFAPYKHRLDFERGGDAPPARFLSVLIELGVAPSHWLSGRSGY
ncbi:MAG: mercuric ion transport protein [Acidimicrobiaceae bacterium]|jgi:hypothetical protein